MTTPRRILLELGSTTTETECGDCPAVDVLKDYWSDDADILCGRYGSVNCDGDRLPSCLAAEASSARMVEIDDALRERIERAWEGTAHHSETWQSIVRDVAYALRAAKSTEGGK